MYILEVAERTGKLIFNPVVAKYLLNQGYEIMDLKADRDNKNKMIFIFKYESEIEVELKKFNLKI